MSSNIKLKRSSVSGKMPQAQDLDYGELAINYTDGKLFYKKSDNTVGELTGNNTSGTVTSVAISSTDGALSVTDSPITQSGTISLNLNTVSVAKGGTGATDATEARTNLSAAKSGANSDITSLSGLTTALSVAQGGTGVTSFASGYLKSNGTALSSTDTIDAADITGSVGAASTLANTGSVTTNSNYYIPFVSSDSSTPQAINTASGLKYNPGTDNLSVGTLNINQGTISTVTLITTNTNSDQIVDSVDGSVYRTVKYVIQVTSGSSYQTSELLVTHDGSTAYYTEFAMIATGSTIASFDVNYVSGNLQLRVTPTNSVTTIRAIRTCIVV